MIFLLQAAILCALFTLIIAKGMKDPIKGIMSYPPAIRRRVESLPQYKGSIKQEERSHIGKKLVAVPVFALVLAGFSWISGARTFPASFLHVFGLFLAVNLWDLVVLDWFWFCRSPKFRIPGTEDMDKEYRDLLFHFWGFCKGVGIGAVVSLLSSGLLALLRAVF
ncbi:MAG: DUF2531 family protein [Clostridiales bacterium]|jgi:hypothetical protein|nr:DUF2531 family protein [Clostridiales bacterium]